LEEIKLGSKEKEGLKNELVEGDLGVAKDSTARVWRIVPGPS